MASAQATQPRDTEEFDQLEDSDYGDAEDYGEDPGDPNAFRIRDPLNVPKASVYTTAELHKMVHEGKIDLSPAYQRDIVWKENKQVALIDSIFRNFYIPPILFLVRNVRYEDDPTDEVEVRICMDGKQRLTSIQKFFDGQIPHKDPVTKKRYWYTRPESQANSRLAIPDHFKRVFQMKEIPCVEYRDLQPGIERDIFQRVQMGIPLAAAEKLQAIESPWADWIFELDAKYISNDDGLRHLIQWDTTRGRNFQCLAQLIYCVERQPKRTEPTVPKLEQWFLRADPPWKQLKDEIEQVMVSYWNIASDANLWFPFKNYKARVAPVEFVFIGVLIATLSEYEDSYIAEQIRHLRDYVRQRHKDVRSNNRVVATMWEFIEDAAAGRRGGQTPAAATVPGRKRKRNGDDEYRPEPVKNIGPAPTTRSKKELKST